VPMMVLFDAPDGKVGIEQRTSTTIAPQALLLMNNTFVLAQSEQFAKRVRRDAGDDAGAQVETAWKLAFGRVPTPKESKDGAAFLSRMSSDKKNAALTRFCQALLSSNEFLYVD